MDFDDTLFDDDRFMSDIFVVFNNYGVDREAFGSAYRQTKEDGWNPIRQAKLIFSKIPNGFIDDIERIFSDSHKYIFDDALAFLKDNPASKCILSFGDNRTQLNKIENSGIVRYFDSINITANHSKEDFFEGLGGDLSRVMFVDDKPKVINTIKVNFPDVFCVLMSRGFDPTTGLDIRADAIIRTFDDLV